MGFTYTFSLNSFSLLFFEVLYGHSFSNRWIGMERKHNKGLGNCSHFKYNEIKEKRKKDD